MEPLNIPGRFSLSLSFRFKLLDLLLHSRHLLFPASVDFESPTRTLRIRFGFTLFFGGTLSLMNIYILRSSFCFSPGDLCMNQAIREFLDLAACIQITLFPESLTLQGIQASSGEELSLLLLHTGLPLLLLS
ncbi:Hypothetical protein PHPALM_10553 [Phytophthora palmivora]|uniref:Uncharacterized protein n=1 Tax=Phytophthora palmivora TaxID=4796 RepID=A0A2P4Y4E8_9STRA|nr:Hypothetical protein PHPALM_10553 [Phytophthora palmivora]